MIFRISVPVPPGPYPRMIAVRTSCMKTTLRCASVDLYWRTLGSDLMFVAYDERPSDSPFVERVWRGRSGDAGEFLSVAASHVEIVIAHVRSTMVVTVRGPETHAAALRYPADAE